MEQEALFCDILNFTLLNLSLHSIRCFSHPRSVFPVQDDLEKNNTHQCPVPRHNDATCPGLLSECQQPRVFC